jgi:hypothetical protein
MRLIIFTSSCASAKIFALAGLSIFTAILAERSPALLQQTPIHESGWGAIRYTQDSTRRPKTLNDVASVFGTDRLHPIGPWRDVEVASCPRLHLSPKISSERLIGQPGRCSSFIFANSTLGVSGTVAWTCRISPVPFDKLMSPPWMRQARDGPRFAHRQPRRGNGNIRDRQ